MRYQIPAKCLSRKARFLPDLFRVAIRARIGRELGTLGHIGASTNLFRSAKPLVDSRVSTQLEELLRAPNCGTASFVMC